MKTSKQLSAELYRATGIGGMGIEDFIKAVQKNAVTSTKLAERKRLQQAVEALKPFAKFGKRLMDGRASVPESGSWYGLDSGCRTEATIDIEHFKAAIEIVDGKPFVRPVRK